MRFGQQPNARAWTRTYHATRARCQQDLPQAPQDENNAPLNVNQEEGRSSIQQTHGSQSGPKHLNGIPNQRKSTATENGGSTPVDEAEVDEVDIGRKELQHNVRTLMRKVPSSVAVITVASYDPELEKQVPMGVAVSSLSTVTLDPPTISFNIKHPSKTLDAIRAANGLFRVHFPAADRGGANIVELFCNGNHADAYDLRKKELKLNVPGSGLRGGQLEASPSRAPQIWSDSVRAAMECKVTQELPVADHSILVAEITNLESKATGDSSILYLDGSYMRPDGSKVVTHGKPKAVASAEGTWTVWDYPLFPQEKERLDYMERIKTIVKENPRYLDRPGKETLRELEATLPLSPSALGINLEKLVATCKKEAGFESELAPHLRLSPALSEFYGRLTPSDRTKIVTRLAKVVEEDSRFLALNYRILLQNLSVSPSSIDLLPSDIMEPLRAEGLVGPFKQRMGARSTNSRDYNLEYLEQVEHKLRDHFAKIGYQKAASSRLDMIMESLGEQRIVSTYFKKCRARLHAAASPELFDDSKIDIAGQVTQEEVRVILGRIVYFLQVENLNVFRKNLLTRDYNDVLRLVGVHPSITGMDVEFFFGKVKHLYYSTRHFRDMAGRVETMLESLLAKSVTWESLEERVKRFVQSYPERAMSWSIRDRLAAIGLHWNVSLSVPVAAEKQPLNRGHILNTLFAKELKRLHSTASMEIKESIAQHLKKQYNFDIDAKSKRTLPVQKGARSSSDDMEEAMLASRNVDVLGNKGDIKKDQTRGLPRKVQRKLQRTYQHSDAER